MKWRVMALACVAAWLLAACSPTQTTHPSPAAAPPAPVTIAAPAAHEAPAPTTTPPPVPQPPDTWHRLRTSFAMHDCVAPAVRRAQRETRYPQVFERNLLRALPAIDYVQRVAANEGIAGEFVLLPWVESHFREVAPRRHRPAGMWQIMSITARSMHLPVTRAYDGRLDKTAATRAAFKLLNGYHKRWGDWRVADMAYNTGGSRMRRIIRSHGMPPATPVIPDLPVGHVTRRHLVKLLAIACIVRDPQRFGVMLPALPTDARLGTVTLPAHSTLKQVAHRAGVSVQQLRKLNAGYRGATVPASSPKTMLLPIHAADALRLALATSRATGHSALTSTHDKTSHESMPSTYTVHSGDSLWSIARQYKLVLAQLRQWNDLPHDPVLQPGQVLLLEPSS